MRSIVLLLLLPGAASAGDIFFAQQGRLTDTLGTPITGTHDIRVTLYDAETNGADVWQTIYEDVSFADGYYSVDVTGPDATARELDVALSSGDARYTGIAIDTPYTDLGPRQRVGYTAAGANDSLLTPLTGLDGSTMYTSNTIAITGTNVPVVAVGDDSAEVVKNGVSTGSNAAIANAGDTVALRLRSSGEVNGVAGATLTIGGATHAWSIETAVVCESGSQFFVHTGAAQTFVVPAACGELALSLWGAGGAGGTFSSADYGAAGGFTGASIETTAGETLTIVVGGGGTYPSGQFRDGGGGGGMSAVLRGTAPLVVAGGGGGGSGCNAYGGAGGGLTGEDGEVYNGWQGRGGTQTLGGAGGDSGGSAGSFLQGGQGFENPGAAGGYGGGGFAGLDLESGGGGGGGYYGGGGGGATVGGCGGGGGGGSSYIGGALNGALVLRGSARVPPETGNTDYASGVGTGGALADGGHGRVVIRW